MEEIDHFSHIVHPLKLIGNLETIVGGGDDGKQEVIFCDGCKEPISDGSAYGCISCRYFLHKTCTQLELTLDHYLHALHPLILHVGYPNKSDWSCDVCDRKQNAGFGYSCSTCDFDICIKCAVIAVAHNAAATALKEEAAVKIQHEGHPQHTLTLQLRPASFHCNACRNDSKDFFYQCDNCDFWIHKTCASLALTIDLPHHHNHPLFLVYSLPDNCYKFPYYCEFCNKRIMQNDWTYHCSNCRYFIHIKCVLNAEESSTPRDGHDVEDQGNDHDFLHFPMPDAFTDPLKLLHFEKITIDDDETTEINHWSHNHPLILNVAPQGNNMSNIGCSDPIKVCHGCVRPLSLPYYSCKDQCSYTLHKYCADLPHTLEHQLHPDHSLDLVNTYGDEYYYQCHGCCSYCNTFVYKCQTCNFYLDVNCVFLPNTIKHDSHKHPLIQVIDPKSLCKACDKWSDFMSYVCKACNFQLGMECAVKSPHFLAHRYCKGHQIPLKYPPVEDHPEEFYCDICELEMHPKFPLYYCHKCKNSFHLNCLNRIDDYANIWLEGTRTVSYHKHPLTFVRRKKTLKYVCSNCNCDINGYLILECRARVCNFKICYLCHRVK